jgi:hypothetical protein
MQVKSMTNNKALREAGLSKSMPILEGINSQIKVLRSMMMRIDDRSTRTVANRVNEMRSTIMFGSIYPLQNLESAPSFFCSR